MRINVIDPKYLADNHLIAEYREMKMAPHFYLLSSKTKNGIDKRKISERYILNKGHAFMWYDKMNFIKKRFDLILLEMKERGFKTNFDKLNFEGIPQEAFGDFSPNLDEKKINLERILLRIAKQPHWYKYKGKGKEDWNKFYKELLETNKL